MISENAFESSFHHLQQRPEVPHLRPGHMEGKSVCVRNFENLPRFFEIRRAFLWRG